jgi:hypothetical protein
MRHHATMEPPPPYSLPAADAWDVFAEKYPGLHVKSDTWAPMERLVTLRPRKTGAPAQEPEPLTATPEPEPDESPDEPEPESEPKTKAPKGKAPSYSDVVRAHARQGSVVTRNRPAPARAAAMQECVVVVGPCGALALCL